MKQPGTDNSPRSSPYSEQIPPPVPDPDPRTIIEAYLTLLDDASHIDDRPVSAHFTTIELFKLLTNAHALRIVDHLFCEKRPLRFTELRDALEISPKVLSQRLRELAAAGLISRRSYDEMPPRVEYEPTPKADDLTPAFQFLYAWAERYDVGPEPTLE